MSEPLWQPRTPGQARALGAGFALVGWALLHWQVTLLLREASEGAETLTYSLTLIAFGEMFLVLGAWFLVRGLAGYQFIRSLQHNAKGQRTIALVALAALALTWWLISDRLAAYGYH